MTLKPILDFIEQLAPLSVIVAALGLLNNYRQAERRRSDDKAQRTRVLLSELSTAAYVMTWTSLAKAEVELAILHLRDELQKRLGADATAQSIRDLMNDQRLREALIHEAFAASGCNARAEQELRSFARLRASVEFQNAAVETAMEAIEAQLRVRLMQAFSLVMALREEGHVLRAGDDSGAGPKTPIAWAHQVLRSDAELPKEEGMTAACKLIEELGNVVLLAPESAVLRLYARPNPIQRYLRWKSRRRDADARAATSARLRAEIVAKFPADAEALAAAIDHIAGDRDELESRRLQLGEAGARFTSIFKDTEGGKKLAEAVEKFRDIRDRDGETRQREIETLLQFKAQGIDDPDIDVFLAASSGVIPLLQSALDRGAHANVGIRSVIRRHAPDSVPRRGA